MSVVMVSYLPPSLPSLPLSLPPSLSPLPPSLSPSLPLLPAYSLPPFLTHSNFLVNCSDRVLRVYDLDQVKGAGETEPKVEGDGEVEALQRLQDLVNRWGREGGREVLGESFKQYLIVTKLYMVNHNYYQAVLFTSV